MALLLVTPPTEEPVSLAEAKAALRYQDDLFDPAIEMALRTAREQIDGPDGWLGRALMTQVWDLTLDYLPACGIDLPLPPLQAVVSVNFMDYDGFSHVLDPSLWRLAAGGSQPSVVIPPYSAYWPTVRTDTQAVRVRFRCGYADASVIPSAIKQWIIAKAGAIMAQPEAVSAGVQIFGVDQFDQLLNSLRVWC